MYGLAGEKRPIFSESDAFLYNLGDPTISYDTFVVLFSKCFIVLLIKCFVVLSSKCFVVLSSKCFVMLSSKCFV
jgi:hypothetical protein